MLQQRTTHTVLQLSGLDGALLAAMKCDINIATAAVEDSALVALEFAGWDAGLFNNTGITTQFTPSTVVGRATTRNHLGTCLCAAERSLALGK